MGLARRMTDWGKGGVAWSLRRWVRSEVRDQMRENPLARRARYPWPIRFMRWFFSIGTFTRFMAVYLVVDLAALNADAWWRVLGGSIPAWPDHPAAEELLAAVPGYLIGAQVGILSVISLALALVTLIAQRDGASTDVQVYYHESIFFEIAASCLALIAVLCIQLFWPLQSAFYLFGGGTGSNLFRFLLLIVHLLWFVINIGAVAHFIGVTFRFIQQSARQKLRERYTANVLIPREIAARVRETMYMVAGSEAIPVADSTINPSLFGMAMHGHYERELIVRFGNSMP